jgi:cation diffusion facilitator CzcD-associated flavoprotein CzcO
MPPEDVVIVGAGPYGLSASAHLRRAGLRPRVLGEPMAFWRTMPAGMLLRSNRGATNIAELHGSLTLDAFEADTGMQAGSPVALERFVEYGEWVQRRAAPDLDRRLAAHIERNGDGFKITLADGERLAARRVVMACGIAEFAHLPPEFAGFGPELVSHTGDHADPARFAGRRVAVVGGGQSALELAALARAAGADVEILVRAPQIVWLRRVTVYRRLGRLAPVVYAPTDVGPLWYSRLNAVPDAFRRLPRSAQARIATRSIRPACTHRVREALDGVEIRLGTRVASARRAGARLELALDSGERLTVDHLLLGTGYRVDIARYAVLAPELRRAVRTVAGFPVLGRGMESSVPGLHFLGAPAARSFGPIMRFVSGTWYGGAQLARAVAAR